MTKGFFARWALAGAAIGALAGYVTVSWAQTPERRHFTVLAVEPRGGTQVTQEPFPSEPLPAGGGYVIRQPDANGRWEVSTYVWSPAQIIVRQGDHVVIDFVGINGAEHPTELRGLGRTFSLRRGQVHRVEFVAEAPGVHPVICGTHQPSMRGEIVVLPRA
jgi:plastocyanin